MSKNPDDDDNVRPIYRTSFGEIGIVIVAAFCTLALICMMILPSPFAKYEKAQAKQPQEARQTALAAPLPVGEVSAGISPAAGARKRRGQLVGGGGEKVARGGTTSEEVIRVTQEF